MTDLAPIAPRSQGAILQQCASFVDKKRTTGNRGDVAAAALKIRCSLAAGRFRNNSFRHAAAAAAARSAVRCAAGGSHVGRPVWGLRGQCGPSFGRSREGRMRWRERRACLRVSRRDRQIRHAPLAAHVWAARCGPSAGRSRNPGERGPLRGSERARRRKRHGLATERACLAAIATHRWRLTREQPGAGPLPAAAGDGGCDCASAVPVSPRSPRSGTHRWRLTRRPPFAGPLLAAAGEGGIPANAIARAPYLSRRDRHAPLGPAGPALAAHT